MNKELEKFLKSQDFMRLGKSINAGQWQSAMMTITRMQNLLKEMGVEDFDRNLTSLRGLIMQKDKAGAQDILAVIINKRVQMLKAGE